jgi:hypothetical protein
MSVYFERTAFTADGCTITHVSRTLAPLKREGMVSLSGDRLTVHREQELAALALLPHDAG